MVAHLVGSARSVQTALLPHIIRLGVCGLAAMLPSYGMHHNYYDYVCTASHIIHYYVPCIFPWTTPHTPFAIFALQVVPTGTCV